MVNSVPIKGKYRNIWMDLVNSVTGSAEVFDKQENQSDGYLSTLLHTVCERIFALQTYFY